MPSFPIHVIQDGANFYVSDPAGNEIHSLTRHAPFKVLDFDMEAATRARKWFIDLCSKNQRIVWES